MSKMINWDDVEAWAQRKLQAAREANDNPAMSELETAKLRGRISLAKELIALPQTFEFEAAQSDVAGLPPTY